MYTRPTYIFIDTYAVSWYITIVTNIFAHFPLLQLSCSLKPTFLPFYLRKKKSFAALIAIYLLSFVFPFKHNN